MLKYFVEFIGTFLFLSVILNSTAPNSTVGNNAPFAIGLALVAMILFGGNISGGHFNPAVSFMMILNNNLNSNDLIPYVSAQLLGAFLAYYFYNMNLQKNLN
jgi:aquaporin Z